MTEFKMEKNIDGLIEKHDAFIFDAFGVFNLNGKLSKDAIATMENILKKGKPLYILSNSTAGVEKSEISYNKKGLIKGVHYTELVTSGEFGHQQILKGNIPVKGKKVWVLGEANASNSDRMPEALNNTGAIIVDDIKDADFAYCGIPRINGKDLEYNSNTGLRDNAENFMSDLAELKEKNIPMIGFNPDYFSFENGMKAIRQGAIVGAYEEMGGETIVCGKPDVKIYEYVIEKIKDNHGITDLKSIMMVGDTARTDIDGANKVGISSCLLLRFGVSYLEYVGGREYKKGQKTSKKMFMDNLKKELEKKGMNPTYIAKGIASKGKG